MTVVRSPRNGNTAGGRLFVPGTKAGAALRACLPEGSAPWMAEALCAQTDPEVFYPEKGHNSRQAKAVCLACPVTSRCLEWALQRRERFGIWGATTERERRKLLGRAG